MDHNRKIFFHIHNLSRGGAERVVVNLAARFAGEGFDVRIATEEKAKVEYDVPEGVARLDVGIRSNTASRLLNLMKRKKRLRECLKVERPELVIAFGRSANYRAVAAAKGICPVIVSVRNDPKVEYAGRLNGLFIRRYLNHADGCVFQTKEARAFFSQTLQKKSDIILNPVHEKYINVPYREKRKPVIVNVGRIAAQKNQCLLIHAFAKLAAEFPEYRLLIYGADSGDGTNEKLIREIRESGFEKRIALMGNSDNLQEEIADASLFVLSSDYEGMPNALMEAMAMGIPCISTDCPCGGPAMLIHDGKDGLLVPAGDEIRMSEAMRSLLADPAYAGRLGRAARRIGERAGIETVYGQWKQYVDEVTGWAGAGKRADA